MPPSHGSPCWVEIPATGEVEDLKEFYTQIFPAWTFRPHNDGVDDPNIAYFDTQQGLSGGIVQMPPMKPQVQAMGSGMTVYYFVSDLEETEKQVHALGGKTCLEKKAERTNGWFMNFNDPQGNRFGAFKVNQ